MTTYSPEDILTEDQILDLEEEQRRLHSRRAVIQERMDEITRALVSSGEARLRFGTPVDDCSACQSASDEVGATGPCPLHSEKEAGR